MKREHRSSWARALCTIAAAATCAIPAAALGRISAAERISAPQDSTVAPVRYARVKSAGVKMFNLADKKGEVVLTMPADGILAIYSERAGYLEAEAPQNLEVWIYGKFVKPTSDASLLEATETLLMRPLPSSDEKSYPLGQRLHKGERVRMLARADESKPFKEDWIKVLAPPGTRAWVLASDTTSMASGPEALAAWNSAVKSAQAATAARVAAVPIAAAGAKSAEEASAPKAAGQGDALAEAQKLLNAAKASASPDYGPPRAAFQKIIDDAPKSSSAEVARVGLEKIDVLEQIERLKSDAKLVEQKRQEELEKANARLRELSAKQDPLWGRFQARGWVERDGGHYLIRWSGKPTAEIQCKSGRYEIGDYVGFEVGINGVTLRNAIAASGAGEAQAPVLDVTRIEVISGRVN
jgi:hypothetical protein